MIQKLQKVIFSALIMKIFLTLIVTISCYSSFSQGIEVKKITLFEYKKFESRGEMLNGQKSGKWIDIANDSIIYLEAYYDKGKPVSNWKINYPDGTIRKQIEYDSLGNIIKWSRFLKTNKIYDINPDSIIEPMIMYKISSIEENLFNDESWEYQPVITSIVNKQTAYNAASMMNNVKLQQMNYNKIHDVLLNTTFSGQCLRYANGKMISKSIIKNGRLIEQRRYFYKRNRLRTECVFIDNKLVKELLYNKDGNLIKGKNK
jgi:antitoxin component YwqK of YwqJK toxin-antitoxin module